MAFLKQMLVKFVMSFIQKVPLSTLMEQTLMQWLEFAIRDPLVEMFLT